MRSTTRRAPTPHGARSRDLPGLDAVLSAGSARGVEAGMEVLLRRAAVAAAPLMLVGGGLRRKHVAVLAAAGVDAFHVGAAVRSARPRGRRSGRRRTRTRLAGARRRLTVPDRTFEPQV